MLDMGLKQLQYNVVLAAAALAVIFVVATGTEQVLGIIAVAVVSYFWGAMVAWQVSKEIYIRYNHNYLHRHVAIYAAWFASWLGMFVLLAWLAELKRAACTVHGAKVAR